MSKEKTDKQKKALKAAGIVAGVAATAVAGAIIAKNVKKARTKKLAKKD